MAKEKAEVEVKDEPKVEAVAETKAEVKVSKKYKFKLLAGKYVGCGGDDAVKFVAGDVVESDDRLDQIFGKEKFELKAE
jgi:hypothetical protein